VHSSPSRITEWDSDEKDRRSFENPTFQGQRQRADSSVNLGSMGFVVMGTGLRITRREQAQRTAEDGVGGNGQNGAAKAMGRRVRKDRRDGLTTD
jgi:hypothetical protein